MIIATKIDDVRKQVKEWKAEGLTVGLVPTMGALHEGHASLVAAAAKDCDRVVASVFVNPTQFGEGEDLESYPRDFEHDCEVLEKNGCSMVFHPEVEEMYPAGFGTYVNVENGMTEKLCGKSRPIHFRGVCTVVSKLFHIVTPDRAYFGQKDAQQLAVIRRMVLDQAMGIEIVGCPIIREADGLAKSSRNVYMDEAERKAAIVLHKALKKARQMIDEDSIMDSEQLINAMTEILSAEPKAKIDYVEAVDGLTLKSKKELEPGDLVAMAVYIGTTRLIDNFTV